MEFLNLLFLEIYFYPRSPCGERQRNEYDGAQQRQNFYPRSPCGERRPPRSTLTVAIDFYPRSPCGERQVRMFTISGRVFGFLSTLSLRRATSDGHTPIA